MPGLARVREIENDTDRDRAIARARETRRRETRLGAKFSFYVLRFAHVAAVTCTSYIHVMTMTSQTCIFLSSARLFRAVFGPMVWLVDSSLIVSRDSHENRALEHENWKKKTARFEPPSRTADWEGGCG